MIYKNRDYFFSLSFSLFNARNINHDDDSLLRMFTNFLENESCIIDRFSCRNIERNSLVPRDYGGSDMAARSFMGHMQMRGYAQGHCTSGFRFLLSQESARTEEERAFSRARAGANIKDWARGTQISVLIHLFFATGRLCRRNEWPSR